MGTEKLYSLEEYAAIVAKNIDPMRERVKMPLELAYGRTLAEKIVSKTMVPALDNSAMDGFAVNSADIVKRSENSNELETLEITLPLAETVAAGTGQTKLPAGHAAPIMTGAPLPKGADMVIKVEDTKQGNFNELGNSVTVRVSCEPTRWPGQFVRYAGSDTQKGDVVAQVGDVLTPARIGVIASVGVHEVEVYETLNALVLATGDEVSRKQNRNGKIFDTNSYAVAAALSAAGVNVVGAETVGDDIEQLHALVQTYAGMIDFIVSTGGVSKGQFEVIRLASAAKLIDVAAQRVKMQPGGPQGLGDVRLAGKKVPWIALPGNPVSALISVEMFLRPALMGRKDAGRIELDLPLAQLPETGETSPKGKTQLRRARINLDGTVSLVGGASSHLIGAFAAANALAIVPEDTELLHNGDTVKVRILG